MRLKHISDDEIQDYLDGNITSEKESIEAHLRLCKTCQTNLELYRELYGELASEGSMELSADFADTVISRLQTTEAKKFRTSLLNIIAVILGAVVCIVITAHYVDLSSLFPALPGGSMFDIKIDAFDFGAVKQLISDWGSGLNILLFAAAIIVVIAAIDRLFLNPKTRRFRSRYDIILV